MHFPRCFNECLHASQEIQENENKESSEEYLNINITLKNNKTDSNASASLKNYCGPQDVANNEMAHWEKEIKLMTESMKRIYKALSSDTKVEDLFEFDAKKFEDKKMMDGEGDLKASFEMIDKMDVLLKVKVAEEKKAKLSRIQAEEESRNILTKLPQSTWSNGIKINLEEFMRLLNEVEKTENDSLTGQELNETVNLESGDCYEKNGEEEEKNEKTSCEHQKTTNSKFVERNIQLAKCGRGTLSLTDEEKLRIEHLLGELEDSDLKFTKDSREAEHPKTEKNRQNKEELYAFDGDTKFVLSQIDQRLEVLKKRKSLEECRSGLEPLESSEFGPKVNEREDEKNPNKKGKKKKKKPNRLKEINKLLNSMNSVSSEEIIPLTVEEIDYLVQQSQQSLNQQHLIAEECCEAKEIEGVASTPPPEVIAELVSSAKLLMPKFKYRFDVS